MSALSSLDLCHAQFALERELKEGEAMLVTLRASRGFENVIAEDEQRVSEMRARVERFRAAHLAACRGEGIALIGGPA